MSSHRTRGQSPPRYYSDQARATTGAVYVTSFDTNSRGGPSSPQTRANASASAVSSGRHSIAYQAQPVHTSTYPDGKTRTQYTVRPKHDTESKRPLHISTRNPSPPRRGSAFVSSPREMTPRDDSSRWLQPASPYPRSSGFHQRHNSTSLTESDPRDHREKRSEPPRTRAPYVEKVYHSDRPMARAVQDEDFSYTGPREQFARDFPLRPAGHRDSSSRKERSLNDYENDRPATKRDLTLPPPPPPSTGKELVRHDKGDRDPYASRHGYDSDPDHASEHSRRNHSYRAPVLHQQHLRDDGYASARDDFNSKNKFRQTNGKYYDDPRPRDRQRDVPRDRERDRDSDRKHHRSTRDRESDRDYDRRYHRDRYPDSERTRDHDREYDRDEKGYDERRKPRSRDSSPEQSGLKGFAKTALGGLAAAGVVKSLNRDQPDKERGKDPEAEDEEPKERRRRRHRRRSQADDQNDNSEVDKERRKDDRTRSNNHDSSSSDTPDGEPRRRRHSRRRHRGEEDASNNKLIPIDEHNGREVSRTRPRDQPGSDVDVDRSSRALVLSPESREDRAMSQSENEEERPRRVHVVEPTQEKEELKPRGILKPARQVPFPEDPNPIREGVAPLKDATKDGIPPNARWTKINRFLVNPEALEKAHERFEERDDYVIVLRVLSREEIKKLADKTKEIREARERDWQKKVDEQRRRGLTDQAETYSDGEINYDRDDGSRTQLAIEQGPPAPPADFYNLQNATTQAIPQHVGMTAPPPPDINVEASYSQNV